MEPVQNMCRIATVGAGSPLLQGSHERRRVGVSHRTGLGRHAARCHQREQGVPVRIVGPLSKGMGEGVRLPGQDIVAIQNDPQHLFRTIPY